MAKKGSKENLTKMTREELVKKLRTFREDLRVIKFKAEGAKPKNVKESALLKKQIARVLTALNK